MVRYGAEEQLEVLCVVRCMTHVPATLKYHEKSHKVRIHDDLRNL